MDLEIDIIITQLHFHLPSVFKYLKNFNYQNFNQNPFDSKKINV